MGTIPIRPILPLITDHVPITGIHPLDDLILSYLPPATEVLLAPGLSRRPRPFLFPDGIILIGDAVVEDRPELIGLIMKRILDCEMKWSGSSEKRKLVLREIMPHIIEDIRRLLHVAMNHATSSCFSALMDAVGWIRGKNGNVNIERCVSIGLGKEDPPAGRERRDWAFGLYLDDKNEYLPSGHRFDEMFPNYGIPPAGVDGPLLETIIHHNQRISDILLEKFFLAEGIAGLIFCDAIVNHGRQYLDRVIKYVSGNKGYQRCLMLEASTCKDRVAAREVMTRLESAGIPFALDLLDVIRLGDEKMIRDANGRLQDQDMINFLNCSRVFGMEGFKPETVEEVAGALGAAIEFLEGKLLFFDLERGQTFHMSSPLNASFIPHLTRIAGRLGETDNESLHACRKRLLAIMATAPRPDV